MRGVHNAVVTPSEMYKNVFGVDASYSVVVYCSMHATEMHMLRKVQLFSVHAVKNMADNKDGKLIEEIRNYPWMYETNRKDFRDIKKKFNSWVEIATKLDMTGRKIKSKILHLRNILYKHINWINT